MDQYPATSVRLAKFLERFEGNIRGFMIDFAGTLSSLGDKLDVIQTEYDKNKQLRHDKIHLVLNGIYIGTVGSMYLT